MEKLVRLAKIFSDINRLRILGLILRDKEPCVCEICDTLKLSQPLVSRHLKSMKEEEILSSKQQGKWIIYSLSNDLNPHLEYWINEVQKHISALPKLIACNTK